MDALPAARRRSTLLEASRIDAHTALHDMREVLAALTDVLASQAERSRGFANAA